MTITVTRNRRKPVPRSRIKLRPMTERLYCWLWLALDALLPRRRYFWVQRAMDWLDGHRAVAVRECLTARIEILQMEVSRLRDQLHAGYTNGREYLAYEILTATDEARVAGMDSWDAADMIREMCIAVFETGLPPEKWFDHEAA